MCGIVGYIGNKQALPFLIEGLKKLEYRGYDSAGVCVSDRDNLFLVKNKGKVDELENKVVHFGVLGNMGIAHTRWATHGQPNETNAHPHMDCTGNIAIVHNGIVENYGALKELLQKEGHKIVSDTDSEIIAHLIEKFYLPSHHLSSDELVVMGGGNLESAVAEALKLIEGAYALAILDKNSDMLVAARKSSPLVLGIGKNENFISSDVAAVVKETKRIVYLDDNEIAVLTGQGYSVKNLNGQLVDKKISEVALSIGEIEKKGFKHFMLKEIFEQPEAIENTMRGRIKDGSIKINLSIDFKRVKRIIIIACGTSWHSGLIAKYIIEKYARIPVEVDYASEFRYRNPVIDSNDLVIVISQSGETADTLAALKESKEKRSKSLGIINVVGSSISREVDSGIYLHAGPEIGVASTKAFTCQITALTILGLHIAKIRGQKVEENIFNEIAKVPELIRDFLKNSDELRVMAETFKDSRNFLYLGRNINFPVALEGALKLKEISYIHAEGYPAAEMKHGPIALIDENMPVVFICPKDDTYNKILSNMEEIKARQGKIIAVINEDDGKVSRLADHVIKVPKTIDILSPLVNVIPLQFLAYHIADLKGLNVDKPRNLAKSVTVE